LAILIGIGYILFLLRSQATLVTRTERFQAVLQIVDIVGVRDFLLFSGIQMTAVADARAVQAELQI
jgi:hypothetical protein